jgi:imidazolonepropionase-like amidohydrolase
VLAAGVLLGGCAPPSPAPDVPPEAGARTLFEGARVIVGDGSLIEAADLLIEGDRILALDEIGVIDPPPGATRVDLSGKTVVPAFIDAHAHLGYEGYTTWGAESYSRENLIEHLERYAYHGFAAVFSAGTDPGELALELARSQEEGSLGGARLLFAAGVGPPGQGPNNQFLGHALAVAEETGMTVLRGAATPQEGRAVVREIAAAQISFVKIWVDDRGGSQEKLRPEVYRAVIEEAALHGLPVVVHQQSAADMSDLLDAGVSGFLHGRLGPALDAALAAKISASDAFLVPNLGLGELRRERVGDDPFLQETAPPGVVERLRNAFDERAVPPVAAEAAARERELSQAFSRLLSADVDIVLGTDAGASPDHFFGYSGHRELEIFVRLGMTPMQALVAATSRPAARLGLGDLGTLAPGMSADFVVLDASPLDDIRNTRSISEVYLRGQRIDRDGLRSRWTGTAR